MSAGANVTLNERLGTLAETNKQTFNRPFKPVARGFEPPRYYFEKTDVPAILAPCRSPRRNDILDGVGRISSCSPPSFQRLPCHTCRAPSLSRHPSVYGES